jgi:hypothetical protein
VQKSEVSDPLGVCSKLRQLIAQEGIIPVRRRESFSSYEKYTCTFLENHLEQGFSGEECVDWRVLALILAKWFLFYMWVRTVSDVGLGDTSNIL